jgi:hypothetical protein
MKLFILTFLAVVIPSVALSESKVIGSDEYLNGLMQLAAEADPTVTTPNTCNGGSCNAGGTTLNCPNSGGNLTCTADQRCTCWCAGVDGGGVVAVNECIKTPTSRAVFATPSLQTVVE